jgi:hypothetical protein
MLYAPHEIMMPMLAKFSIKNTKTVAEENFLKRSLTDVSLRTFADICSKMRRSANVVNNCSKAWLITMPECGLRKKKVRKTNFQKEIRFIPPDHQKSWKATCSVISESCSLVNICVLRLPGQYPI